MRGSTAGTGSSASAAFSGPEALLSAVQLWKACALFPRFVSAPRSVLDAMVHPADPYQDQENKRSALLKRTFAAAAPPCAFHGPVDTLDSPSPANIHSAPSAWASPSRKHPRTSHGAQQQHQPQQNQQTGSLSSSQQQGGQHQLVLQPSVSGGGGAQQAQQLTSHTQHVSYGSAGATTGRGRGRHGPSAGRQQHPVASSKYNTNHLAPFQAGLAQQDQLLLESTLQPLPYQPDNLNYFGSSSLPHCSESQPVYTSQTPSRTTSSSSEDMATGVDLDYLEHCPRRRRTGVSRRPRGDMEDYCVSFIASVLLPEVSPAPSSVTDTEGGSFYPEAGGTAGASTRLEATSSSIGAADPVQQRALSTHQASSEDPSSLSLSGSLQSSADTLKGRPLSPSSPLSDGLF